MVQIISRTHKAVMHLTEKKTFRHIIFFYNTCILFGPFMWTMNTKRMNVQGKNTISVGQPAHHFYLTEK